MINETITLSMYIISFMLGAVVTALNIIVSKKQGTRESHIFKILGLALLFYLIFEFSIYYNIGNKNYDSIISIGMTLSNICYYFFIYYWIQLLNELNRKKFERRRYIFIICAYGITAENIGIFKSDIEINTGFFQVLPGIGQQMLLIMNIIFGVWIFYTAAKHLYAGINLSEKGKNKKGAITFSSILMIYMLWIIIWDYNIVSGRKLETVDGLLFDPMIIIYIAYSVSVIWIFYKKDPLGIIIGSHGKDSLINEIQQKSIGEKEFQQIAKIYGLTERETEVLKSVNKGLSNAEIGRELFIAENTVKRHLNNIFNKTGIKSRYELLAMLFNYEYNKNEN